MIILYPCSTTLKSRKLLSGNEPFFADESFLSGSDWLFTVHVGAVHLMIIFSFGLHYCDERK